MSTTNRRGDAQPRPLARHGQLPRPSAMKLIGKGLALLVAIAVASTVSIVAIAAWDLSRSIQTVHLGTGPAAGPVPEISAIEGGVNMLLVGSDSRADSTYSYGEDPESELNDVTMLLHISQDHTSATVVSFPRDTFVPIPECPDPEGGTFDAMESQKINTTLSYGGLACTVLTVEQLTGLTIPFAAEIKFDGVIEMSNAVGGVPVCVAAPIEDTHTELYLDAGTHELQGVDALKFLRTRYGVGDGSDVTRISSQQVFLSALVRKVKSADTLTDVSKLYGLAKAAVSNMVFSDSLNIDNLVQIAKALQPIDLSQIVFVQYPTVEADGGLEPNTESADALFTALSTDQAVGLTSTDEGRGSVVDPNAVPAPTDSAAPVEPDPAASTPAVAELPDDVLGQTAAEARCTVGRTLDDQ
ncbi:LCP family protein [Naasia lichenicola]|uniref:LCP family protein n=1 Tax=Naasia lichenicola TaxID=2565933 RepID=UPI001E490848|nr:LCP family protein [Naasia lichenicola]